MARRSKKRCLPRGARGPVKSQPMYDLNVTLPAASRSTDGRRRAAADRRALVDRLRSVGYSAAAFSHTVYGKPSAERDGAGDVMPWSYGGDERGGADSVKDGGEAGAKGDGESGRGGGGRGQLRILRRLNVVVEESSDLAQYTDINGTSDTDDVLRSYDLISISARSDAAFVAACSTARAADILVLDYTAGRGGVQLPHRVRTSDIRSATERGASFEIPYGPAILDPAKRKALVRTAAELRNACLGVRNPAPRIVLSSGPRMDPDGTDRGALAIRTPGDLANVMRAVLGFDDRVAGDAMGEAPRWAVDRGRARRIGRALSPPARGKGGGGGRVVSVSVAAVADGKREECAGAPLAGEMAEALKRCSDKGSTKKARKASDKSRNAEKSPGRDDGSWDAPADVKQEDSGHEDGFITLS